MNNNEDEEQFTNQEIIKATRDKINKQDEMLDELHGLLVQTKKANKEINKEIENQKPMLENIDHTMDKIDANLKINSKKLDKYDNNSSNCTLITIIWIEIIVMFIILFYL
jgi:small-conductance mechanosensitive channel